MTTSLPFLDSMPTAADFYGLYWNRQPFVVRAAIPKETRDILITADELAGLAMDDAAQSRMVRTAEEYADWSCQFGPFTEQDFTAAGAEGWALLVQNVEQFHPDTATLLRHFSFAPRWLMDDVMVSFSSPGGTVGPHIDSYHVFLVQGSGLRRWKVGRSPIRDEAFVPGMDLKVLAGGFDGDEVEMNPGDVLYLPPAFGHEGSTLESALTFSVGFLGPRLSDLYTAYGQYLSEHEDLDNRFVGQGLGIESAGFTINETAADDIRDRLAGHLNGPDFTRWLVAFFTESRHEDLATYSERDETLTKEQLAEKLGQGAGLIKPEYVKFALATAPNGDRLLGFEGESIRLTESQLAIVQHLMNERDVTEASHPGLLEHPDVLELLCDLYNHQVLELTATNPGA